MLMLWCKSSKTATRLADWVMIPALDGLFNLLVQSDPIYGRTLLASLSVAVTPVLEKTRAVRSIRWSPRVDDRAPAPVPKPLEGWQTVCGL